MVRHVFCQLVEQEIERHLHWLLTVTDTRSDGAQASWSVMVERVDELKLKESGPTVVTVFAIDGQGRVMSPMMGLAYQPEPVVLAAIPAQEKGVVSLSVEGGPACLAYRRLKPGLTVVRLGHSKDLMSPVLAGLRWLALLVTLALVFLIAGLSAWLARRELGNPLRRLTEEADRVAAGDLTPPTSLLGRGDELGRLSQALASMTITAQGMVEAA